MEGFTDLLNLVLADSPRLGKVRSPLGSLYYFYVMSLISRCYIFSNLRALAHAVFFLLGILFPYSCLVSPFRH